MPKNNNHKPILHMNHLEALLKASDSGIIKQNALQLRWRDVSRTVRQANSKNKIGIYQQFVYDKTRHSHDAVVVLTEQADLDMELPNLALLVRQVLSESGLDAMLDRDIEAKIGTFFSLKLVSEEELDHAEVSHFQLQLFSPYGNWYFLRSVGYDTAQEYAFSEAQRLHNEAWETILVWAGDVLRVGADEGDTPRSRALARLYSRTQMDTVLGISERVIRIANKNGALPRQECPDGAKRMRAMDVHKIRDDDDFRQQLEDLVEVNIWQIRAVTNLKISFLRNYLQQAGLKSVGRSKSNDPFASVWYNWGDVRRILWDTGGHPTLRDIEQLEDSDGFGREQWWSDRIIQIHEDILEQQRQRQEEKARLRREEREQREALRVQMIDNFPSWIREENIEQFATIHVGPTNSGKTHDAIQELAQARSGWYLAPLRLLAREWFERLNQMGVICNLLTGEERIEIPGAWITSATIEMFNPEIQAECVVVDEAHLLGDNQRGWAWTRAIVNTTASNLQVITAPHGLNLITKFLDSMGVEKGIIHHQRLVPLEVASTPWHLEELPPRAILIAFSRRDVLHLKYQLQRLGRNVSVVYGALPPEVRLKQARRFAEGEADLCVATDAVGMGLNLPADHVIFTAINKFDGNTQRRLMASEVQQIAGRAGRYGFSEQGMVGALDSFMLEQIRAMMKQNIPDERFARLAPRTDEIELLQGDLVERLTIWQQLNAVPDVLRTIVKSTELEDRLELAQFLSLADLNKLGVEAGLTLVNAPVRKESREYWMDCTTAILQDQTLPLPPLPPPAIHEGKSLKDAEMVIACMDVYLWLGYRSMFRHLCLDRDAIVNQRDHLTREIDLALLRKFDPNTRGNRRRASDMWYDDK